jgi:hypothetical protein
LKGHSLARIVFLLLLLAAGGCQYSRWALRDPDYARKYPKSGGGIGKRIKQAVDARHLDMKDGGFVAGGSSQDGQAVWADFGMMHYREPWKESYLAFSGLYSDDLHDAFFGGKLGTRIQSPSRLAPFAGVGGFAGLFHKGTAHDALWFTQHEDEDDDEGFFFDDDCDCDESEWDPGDDGLHPMFAVYPEVGIHYWLNSDTRISASLSYLVSTEGRDYDYLLLGISFSWLDLDEPPNEFLDPPLSPEELNDWEALQPPVDYAESSLSDE